MSLISLIIAATNLSDSALELASKLATAFIDDSTNATYGNWAALTRVPGNQCVKAVNLLQMADRTKPLWFYRGVLNRDSEGGCGVIMRIAPLGWTHYINISRAARMGALCSITHSADSSIIASACFAGANAAALQGKSIDQIIDITHKIATTYESAIARAKANNDRTSVSQNQ